MSQHQVAKAVAGNVYTEWVSENLVVFLGNYLLLLQLVNVVELQMLFLYDRQLHQTVQL